MAQQSRKGKNEEGMKELQKELEKLGPYTTIMALLSQGIISEKLSSQWMFFVLFYLKRLHNLMATLVGMLVLAAIYMAITFIMNHSNDPRIIFNHAGAFALAVVIMWGVMKAKKISKKGDGNANTKK
jgi:lipopolysaccharide/colanic/teichoic acid biosynthesis glycosyltransferase